VGDFNARIAKKGRQEVFKPITGKWSLHGVSKEKRFITMNTCMQIFSNSYSLTPYSVYITSTGTKFINLLAPEFYI
jgi:hypothetical protein